MINMIVICEIIHGTHLNTTKLCIETIISSNVGAWVKCNAMFYETFICFYVSEAKPLCFSLCSQMFDDVERR